MRGTGRRVAITGLGVVAPCGLGKEAFWQGLLGPGLSGAGPSSVISDWDPSPYYASPKESRRADLVEQFALAAAIEAIEQAGQLTADPARIGTIFGTGVGGIHTLEEQEHIRLDKGERRVSPFLVPMMMANASGAAVSMRFGYRGPNETICTACAAGTHALTYAARLIAWDMADAVVSGGTEHAGTVTAIAGFTNMTAISSTGTSRPFDVDRDGFVMGEGAAAFVLEEWESANARGATILGEVLGGASNADAHHITAPSPGGVGAITCMKQALADAGLEPDDIKQINAHGTSTPLNDRFETMAIRDVFGEHADRLAVSSTKSMTGHAMGAAGAIEAYVCARVVSTGCIPPTINYRHPDPELTLDYVPNEARSADVRVALSNSMGLGGHNSSVIIRRYEE
jgi:3-oxoacyl-[acyl-carrier-protein] synthase II